MQFQSELELKIKVLDKELDELEKRIEKVANPFTASGGKRNDKKLRAAKQAQKAELDLIRQAVEAEDRLRETKAEKRVQTNLRRIRFLRDERIKAARQSEQAAEQLARKRQQRIQGLQLGVGFPLLFGGGAGSVAGGALGALTDSAGGFGGQILFSALGQQIDTFIQNLSNLADSLESAESILDGLADAGLRVSKELRTAVETLEDQGRFIEAYNVALGELERRFGPNAVQELANYDAANAALQEKFSEIAAELQRDLLPALTLVSAAVAGLLGLINQSGGFLKFLAGLVPGGQGIAAAATIGTEGARRITSSPTNAFGFQGSTGASAAADKDRLAREEASAKLVREINRNQEAISRAREQAASKELKHQQAVLKLTRDRALLEAQLIEDQLRLQQQQRDFLLEQARLKAAGESALLGAEQETAAAALSTLQSGGTSPGFASAQEAFASKLAVEYDLINEKVEKLGDALIASGASTEAITVATSAYRAELQAAAKEANRLEQARFRTTDELFRIRAAYLQQESKILLETDEKAKKLLERQLAYAKAFEEVKKAGLDPETGTGKTYIDSVLMKFDAANKQLNDFDQKIEDLTRSIGTALASAVETALVDTIAAAIQGTDDLSEKLQALASNLLSTIGQLLFRTGIGMIGDANQGNILGTLFGTRATGGPVDNATPYIVGERGPELFIPNQSGSIMTNGQSKAALSQFSPGNSSSTGTYGNDNMLSSGTDGPDAPGNFSFKLETTVINGVEYATVDQVRAMGAEATKEGAKQGEAKALRKLQMFPAARRKVGL